VTSQPPVHKEQEDKRNRQNAERRRKKTEEEGWHVGILFVYVTVLSVSFTDERLQFSQMG